MGFAIFSSRVPPLFIDTRCQATRESLAGAPEMIPDHLARHGRVTQTP